MKLGDAIIPAEVYQDHRLTLVQMRVLCALYSFGVCFWKENPNPTKRQIADRCGYTEREIINAIKGLERLGWITKYEDKSGDVRYQIGASDTREEQQ